MKKHHVAKFQSEIGLLFLIRTTWKQRKNIVASEKAYSSLKFSLLRSLTNCLDMEQCVHVPASVYNRSLNTQSVTKQKLPNYQPLQNPTYQIGSLKKEISKKIFSKADSLVDKISPCPRIKLSNSQTLILDDVEIEFFLLESPKHLCCTNSDVPDIYFILLDATGLSQALILNQNAKAK